MTKENLLKLAVIPGAIALAVCLLSSVIPFSADGVAGYGTVLFLVGIAAIEYRVKGKRSVSR
jgi:threonine/homoserine efflux transporter RhtA